MALMSLLLALKVEHPDNVHLLRGNHEEADINALFGFRIECIERLGEEAGVQNFVIFSRARSGTTWLISMLNGHPEISCDGELLLKVKTDAALKQFYAAFDRSGRLHEGTKAREASKRRIGAQGFKWFHYQGGIHLFQPYAPFYSGQCEAFFIR